MPDEEVVMICVEVGTEGHVVEGSMVTNCKECGKGLWISQQSIFEHPEAQAICMECAMPGLLRPDAEFPQAEGNPEVALIVQAIKAGWRP